MLHAMRLALAYFSSDTKMTKAEILEKQEAVISMHSTSMHSQAQVARRHTQRLDLKTIEKLQQDFK